MGCDRYWKSSPSAIPKQKIWIPTNSSTTVSCDSYRRVILSIRCIAKQWSAIYRAPTKSILFGFPRCVRAGNKPLCGTSTQAVLIETAGRLAGTVKAGDNLTVHVHHLALDVDP